MCFISERFPHFLKVIIHETKITDTPQIFLMLAFKIKAFLHFDFCHRFTCFLFLV